MSLETLSRDIFSNAQEEIKNLEQKNQEEISQLREEAHRRVEQFKEDLYKKYSLESQGLRDTILGFYKKEAKKHLLETQKNVLEDIRNEIIKKIKVDQEIKENFYKKIYLVAKEEMKISLVITSTSDKKIVEKIIHKSITLESKKNIDGIEFHSKDKKNVITIFFSDIIDEIISEQGERIYEELLLRK